MFMLEKSRNFENYEAKAEIIGSKDYKGINGNVYFETYKDGVIVTAEVDGLPHFKECCAGNVFAFHIHEGGSCTGNEEDVFADVGMHYNPKNCLHPFHAGDLPPLFENNGYAYMSFFTNRFTLEEVIGKAVIIHDKPDDFHSQPSGNAGKKIACGIIRRK